MKTKMPVTEDGGSSPEKTETRKARRENTKSSLASSRSYQASFKFEQMLEATKGTVLTPMTVLPEEKFEISTDTRTIGKGQWFLPLSGPNFDGHHFLKQAIEQGANGAFVSQASWEESRQEWQGLPNLIAVASPLKAYLDLAKWHRLHVNPKLKVLALTGSSGKTTTKEMLFAAFSGIRETQKTLKNFNNEVGVSQTLLAIAPETELAIVEMGMRGLHQIDILSDTALPDLAIINNVGPAHIELLGSLENVAKAKLEIAVGLNPTSGVLLTNGDDPLLNAMAPEIWQPPDLKQWQTFSLKAAANIAPTQEGGVSFDYVPKTGHAYRVCLPVPGRHNVQNALAVLKAGEILGLPLEEMIAGLACFQPEGGRWQKQAISGYDNLWVINDAYNANPDSTRASLETFFEVPFAGLSRVLVLGGMKELGDFSAQYHQALATLLARLQQEAPCPLDTLIGVGDEMQAVLSAFSAVMPKKRQPELYHVSNGTELLPLIKTQGLPLSSALYFLKGSRFYQLEAFLTALTPTVL
ncbi:MAG: UDP-N-acetylmuramoyl-tripeptide--D-alanyl-D-alanine ligase [Vampirovibrionales bacterium]|nr:UDP-N-acetylmuramoyl-tripeptide--D-alanyl-D-alanine ligase [Vampirovibrionales bacterium]